MSFSDFPENGFQLRTQIVSPVSPKPLRYPNPSSLPVLEKQMDPEFNDTATHMALQRPAMAPSHDVTPTNAHSPENDQESMEDAEGSPDVQASAGSDTDYGMSVDSNSSGAVNNQASSTIAPHLPQSKANDHASSSEAAAALDDADSAPSPDSDLYEDDASGNAAAVPSLPRQDQSQLPGSATPSITANNATLSSLNLQALLENISASASASASTFAVSASPTEAPNQPAEQTDSSGLHDRLVSHTTPAAAKSPAPLPPAAASLPPRPPTQESPTTYPLGSDIRQYHLHDTSAAVPKFPPNLSTILRPPGNVPPPQPTIGAPGTSTATTGLPPPPIATFHQLPSSVPQQSQVSPSTPSIYRQREPLDQPGTPKLGEEDELVWNGEIQKLYDDFLAAERTYVSQGEWEKFPPHSRLFIGNLPSEKVSKKDIFSVFHKYGKLAQISIKQAYGFVQYLDASACSNALEVEQGVPIRGRKIHLEISKPQKNSKDKGAGENRNRNRRSRSPDYSRGGSGAGNQNRADRYRGGGNNRQGRGRDDYRPPRSPSPRRGRDGHRRSPDLYTGRARSRSRSPYGYGGRRKSPSPQRGLDDECPLPRRDPRNVPDIQIIAKDNPDRAFINHVERSFEARGVRVDVLILSSKLSEAAVVRRQIIEGVLAVLKLDRMAQMTQKFNLSVFNRSGGAENVRFEEYANQDLAICVELVLRAKQLSRPVAPQYNSASYAVSQYGLPVVQQPVAPPPQVSPLYSQQPLQQAQQTQQTPFAQFDSSALQQLLGRVQQQNSTIPPTQPVQQAQFPPPPHLLNAQQRQQFQVPPTADLSRLLASAAAAANPQQNHQQTQNMYSQQQQSATPQPQAQNPSLAGLANNPAWASLLANASRGTSQGQGVQPQNQQQGMQGQPGSGGQRPGQQGAVPDMSSIMAQLARYGQ